MPAVHADIERCLSGPRLSRFMPAAGGDKHLALRLYVWNARICEAFYLPLQFAEVCLRNAIKSALELRYGIGWESNGIFLCTLPRRLVTELNDVTAKERLSKGAALTTDHIVSSLPFGFWAHLLTKNFDHLLWKGGISHAFPHAPSGTTRFDLHNRVEKIREWRNRIAHHNAIFDKKPTAEYQNILSFISWIDPNIFWITKEISQITRVINQRPTV